jgi:hypothetical protein
MMVELHVRGQKEEGRRWKCTMQKLSHHTVASWSSYSPSTLHHIEPSFSSQPTVIIMDSQGSRKKVQQSEQASKAAAGNTADEMEK